MAAVEQLSCERCLSKKSGNFCVDTYRGKLIYPILPEVDGIRKFGEPSQTPNQWVKDCNEYQEQVEGAKRNPAVNVK